MTQMQQVSNNAEVILPAAERPRADAMLKTSRDMSRDEQRFALAFMRGMRFQRVMDSADAPNGPGV